MDSMDMLGAAKASAALGGISKEDLAFDVQYEVKLIEAGAGKWENHDFITISWDNGDMQLSYDLDSDTDKAREYKHRWKPYYDQWKATQVNKPIGYPLEKFFSNDPMKVKAYSLRGIQTVEQLAAQPEGNLPDLGMSAREDWSKAKEFITSMQSAQAMEPLVVKQNALEAANDKLMADNAELLKRLEALETRLTKGSKHKEQ